MGSREEILAAVRRRAVPPAELPSLDQRWITYEDPLQQFAAVLEMVGGRCLVVQSVEEIHAALAENPHYAAAKEIVSLVPGVGNANVDLETIEDPHQLETVDFAIVPGEFGVAENAAIWVTDEGLRHRVIYFIAQHLAIVLDARQMLHNLHEAYRRLSFPRAGFGVFVSGPSKTADIEQSLVIGAHGPRSLTVFCLQG